MPTDQVRGLKAHGSSPAKWIKDRNLSRRELLAATLALGAAPAGAEEPRVRVSQLEAQYQGTPKGLFSCAACTFFLRPRSCKVVTGDISPTGWCKLFDLPD
jgi:hypothetical protein